MRRIAYGNESDDQQQAKRVFTEYRKNISNMKTENEEKQNITELAPIPSEPPEADRLLRRLTDEEIIQGFRYLMNKDRKRD